MKILYISSTSAGMHSKSIYFDLMNEFKSNGHDVTIAYAREKRYKKRTEMYIKNGIRYLGIRTGNISKNSNLLSKGIATLTFDFIFKRAINKYMNIELFDIVLYSTPPITFESTLKYLKSKNKNALFYLMLKDIFPQNAVDLQLMNEHSLVYRYFKKKELNLYILSDKIGVMSQANYEYMQKNNKEIIGKVEILPNTITISKSSKKISKDKFKLPRDKKILLFGGNLGLPQSVPFMIECFDSLKDRDDVYVIIAGSGTHAYLIEEYISNSNNNSIRYFGNLDNEEYMELTSMADVGLIFLDGRFTIPNFPQKILSYMELKLPIICATDKTSDVGDLAQDNQFGLKVSSLNVQEWYNAVVQLIENENILKVMGQNAYDYLLTNFTSDKAYSLIVRHKEN